MNNPTTPKHMRIRNVTRLRIFMGLSLSLVTVGLLISCRDKNEKRSFSEVKGFNTPVQNQEIKLPDMPAPTSAPEASPHGAMGGQTASPHGGDLGPQAAPSGHLKWKLPKGWNSHAGSGMYYAMIKTSDDASANEIGVLALPGEAGGLEANAVRWMGQLGIQLPPDKVSGFLAKSLKIKTKGSMDVTVLDFSSLVQNDDASSMMVAITKPQEDTYFIKMMGKKSALSKHKQDFSAFCNSLEFE